jgi:hypothetical protein
MNKFPMGQIVVTRGCLTLCAEKEINLFELIGRHSRGDDGDLDAEDKQLNKLALEHGSRIFSSYNTPHGKIWIITEADRSSTCCLLPDEY